MFSSKLLFQLLKNDKNPTRSSIAWINFTLKRNIKFKTGLTSVLFVRNIMNGVEEYFINFYLCWTAPYKSYCMTWELVCRGCFLRFLLTVRYLDHSKSNLPLLFSSFVRFQSNSKYSIKNKELIVNRIGFYWIQKCITNLFNSKNAWKMSLRCVTFAATTSKRVRNTRLTSEMTEKDPSNIPYLRYYLT